MKETTAHSTQYSEIPRPSKSSSARQPRKSTQLIREQEKFLTLGQLTVNVAHDFNNLLGVIVGNLELIEPIGGDDRPEAERWREALHAAQRGADLTRRLLGFARNHIPDCKPIDVQRLLGDSAGLFRTAAGEAIELELAIANDLWPCYADRSQLENALLNLVLNARDAMPQGGRIRILAENWRAEDASARNPSLRPGDYVRFRVADNGVGMSEEIVRHAFEPFFTTKPSGQGAGIGLSVVYGLALNAKGDAWIESVPGNGTTVTICLPRAAPPEKQSTMYAPSISKGRGQPILIVEDDRSLRLVATATIRKLGYEVYEASTAREALDVLHRNPQITVLFTDIRLPGGMNGIELAKRARKRHPGLKVLYASGCADCKNVEGCDVRRTDTVLPKPFRAAEIAKHFTALLEQGSEINARTGDVSEKAA